ncbi:MAG: hypothetical protein ABFD03_05720 [Clostridiaceae bacterium]
MNETVLNEHYQKRGFSRELAAQAVDCVRSLSTFLVASGSTLETASSCEIRSFIRLLIREKRNTLENLLALRATST